LAGACCEKTGSLMQMVIEKSMKRFLNHISTCRLLILSVLKRGVSEEQKYESSSTFLCLK